MPVESTTPDFDLAYPTAANAGTAFAGGISDLAAGIDSVLGTLVSDIVTPGVVVPPAGAGLVAGLAVSTAGVVTGTGLGAGIAYIKTAGGIVLRNAIPSGAFSLTPAALPASGMWAGYGLDLAGTTWGGTATLTLSAKSADEASSAAALAAVPSPAAGAQRVMSLAIQNTGSGYVLAASADARVVANAMLLPLAQGIDGVPSPLTATVTDKAGNTAAATILDSLGDSAFVFSALAGRTELYSGTGTVTASGWSPGQWDQFNIAHGAPSQPTWASVVIIPGGSIETGIYVANGWVDTTNINFYAYNSSGFTLGGTIAIGFVALI